MRYVVKDKAERFPHLSGAA